MKKIKTPNFVTIAVLTTITIVFWVLFGVYRVFTTEPSPDVPDDILEDVNPSLDTNALDALQSKLFFEEGQIGEIEFVSTVSPTETQTPTPTETPTATPEATESATPTPTATESGGLTP
jgi:hypothetical protein